jgi:hypothetical protein
MTTDDRIRLLRENAARFRRRAITNPWEADALRRQAQACDRQVMALRRGE